MASSLKISVYISCADAIAPRGYSKNPSAATVLDGDLEKLEEAVNKGEGRTTLQFRKSGPAIVKEVVRKKTKREKS